MRLVLLVASLICAVIATLIGFEILDVANGKAVLLTCAWAAWGLACFVGAVLWPEVQGR